MVKVSIIIPVFNNLNYTKDCLDSIFRIGSKYNFEVIIINNASSDGTKEYLQNFKHDILVKNNIENRGFSKACNQGAELAKGEYLLFLNNDTAVTKNWLDILVEELEDNKSIAIAGSKLLYPDDTIQHAGVVFNDNRLPYHIYLKEKKERVYVNKKRFFQAITGACFLIRNDIFCKVEGFDESYKNGLEDIDLCLKVGELGLLIVYCPESVVYHYESVSKNRFKHASENKKIFLKKWKNKIKVDEKHYLAEDNNLSDYEKSIYLIQQKDQEIKKKDQELFLIKSSKFWKMRNVYVELKNKIKFALFCPKKFIKKYLKK